MSDIDEVISRLWDEKNAPHPATITIAEVSLESDAQNTNLPPLLLDWILIFDQFANWIVSLATLVLAAAKVLGMSEADEEHRAFIPILGSLTSQLVAIRRLVQRG